ncbi:MAG: glucokinase [Vicinamibacteraceae bacterium]|nr:glucokinase [Vicinamibacteraceae bacterium]
MLLAGDLGGTKTLLGLFSSRRPRPEPLDIREFVTLDYPDLPSMVREFLRTTTADTDAVRAAAFGVAGLVGEGEAVLTNVPWRVEVASLEAAAGTPRVALVNDVEAMAWSIAVLDGTELETLQAGTADADGNAVLVSAGTGLGQAFLYYRDGRLWPTPSEGGHCDFAARTARELALVAELASRFGRVDVERVVSGQGIVNLAEFTHRGRCDAWPTDVDPTDVPAYVSSQAMAGTCQACVEAFDMFVEAFGAVAGNIAVQTIPRGGVFLGGGIPPKILPALRDGRFLRAFTAKPPMVGLLETVPVHVILNDRAGLVGASVVARRLAEER